MNLNFDYIKVDPRLFFLGVCSIFFFLDKLLEIKKNLLREEIVDFNIRAVGNVIQDSFNG